MKRHIAILFLIFNSAAFGQNNQACISLNNIYDAYRLRLTNDFMIGIGPDAGMCIPAENRDERIGYKKLRWGDATTQLAAYIMVLSTEYLLYFTVSSNH